MSTNQLPTPLGPTAAAVDELALFDRRCRLGAVFPGRVPKSRRALD